MASYYVWNSAAGAGTGADWTNAYVSLAVALPGKVAGDIFYLAHDHTENYTASTTLVSPTFVPSQFLCVNRAGSVPPVSADLRTTAVVQTTGAFSLTLQGPWYADGLSFVVGLGASTAASINLGTSVGSALIFKNCKLRIATTNTTTSRIVLSANGRNLWDNVTLQAEAATGQGINPNGILQWRNTPSAVVGATITTPLFNINLASAVAVFLEGVDLSAVGTGKTLVGAAASSAGSLILKDCKLNASVTLALSQSNLSAAAVEILNCDSGASNTRNERYRYEGTETTELTIVRTGGATNGTTAVARKIVTTANAKWLVPFDCMPFSIWNETTGSAINLTMEGVWGSGSLPNNDQIWFDVEYPGDATSPLGTYSSGTKADALATGTALASSSSIWGGSTTKFKQTRTITPQAKGWIYVYPKIGIASTTLYLDPEITVT